MLTPEPRTRYRPAGNDRCDLCGEMNDADHVAHTRWQIVLWLWDDGGIFWRAVIGASGVAIMSGLAGALVVVRNATGWW